MRLQRCSSSSCKCSSSAGSCRACFSRGSTTDDDVQRNHLNVMVGSGDPTLVGMKAVTLPSPTDDLYHLREYKLVL